jgi:hypothetical protein
VVHTGRLIKDLGPGYVMSQLIFMHYVGKPSCLVRKRYNRTNGNVNTSEVQSHPKGIDIMEVLTTENHACNL